MTRQLPVGACLRHALQSVRNSIRQAFRVSWPWVLLLGVLGAIVVAFVSYAVEESFMAGFLVVLVWMLAAMLAGAAIAVHWHRYILLDEVSSLGAVLRLDGKIWRYFGNVLLIALAVSAVQLLVAIPARAVAWGTGAGEVVESILSLIMALVGGVLSYRLGVKLPAIALDRRDFRFSHAWEATRGNDLRLLSVFLIQLAATLAIILVPYIALLLLPPIIAVAGFVILLVFLWLISIFNITILTSLYGFFVENRDF